MRALSHQSLTRYAHRLFPEGPAQSLLQQFPLPVQVAPVTPPHAPALRVPAGQQTFVPEQHAVPQMMPPATGVPATHIPF